MSLDEINEDFYCSGNETIVTKRDGFICCQLPPDCENAGCGNYHRKHPTPSQYKEEYGKDYPDEGAAYALMTHGFSSIERWIPVMYSDYKEDGEPIVCACTPFGKPDDSWRPK